MNIFLKILHFVPFVHFYGKWKIVEDSYYTDTGMAFLIQRKECLICKKIKQRKEH